MKKVIMPMTTTNIDTSTKNQLLAQLANMTRRLSQLEKDASDVELFIKQSKEQEEHNTAIITKDLSPRTQEAHQLREDLQSLIKQLSSMSQRFKYLLKKEYLERLNDKINNWPLEEYITREEFNNLLREKLKDQQRLSNS